jgi:Met-zincin
LLHRYQTEAAAKEVGGLNYRYALRGDGQMVTEIVSPAEQKQALSALMETISPQTLTLPESLLEILPPRPEGYPRTQESFAGHTGVTFDPGGAAEAAAEITLGLLFNPQRASRLVEYHARDAQNPGLRDVIEAAVTATWKAPQSKGLQGQAQRITETAVVEHLLGLAANSAASSEARAMARDEVVSLRSFIAAVLPTSNEQKALQAATLARIDSFLKEAEKFAPAPPAPVPPGQPIGDEE